MCFVFHISCFMSLCLYVLLSQCLYFATSLFFNLPIFLSSYLPIFTCPYLTTMSPCFHAPMPLSLASRLSSVDFRLLSLATGPMLHISLHISVTYFRFISGENFVILAQEDLIATSLRSFTSKMSKPYSLYYNFILFNIIFSDIFYYVSKL